MVLVDTRSVVRLNGLCGFEVRREDAKEFLEAERFARGHLAMRIVWLPAIIILGLCACDSTTEHTTDVDAEIKRLQKKAKAFATSGREEMLRRFEPERFAKDLFDFSTLECEKNGICKVQVLNDDNYAYFSVANLISESLDHQRITEIMDDRVESGKLAAGVREGRQEFFNNPKAMLDAAMEDSSRMAILVHLLRDLQSYYREQTARFNAEQSNEDSGAH